MGNEGNDSGREGKERESQGRRIIKLVESEGVELFHDEYKTAHARVPVDGHLQVWPCHSEPFKDWVAGTCWDREDKALSSEGLNSALNVLRSKARFEGDEHRLWNRVAFHDGAIWYDLGDSEWRAVRVTSQGWAIVKNPPILFRRYDHQAAQVEPVKTGRSLADVLGFINVRDEAQAHLLLVYLVTCLVPEIPHPIIVFHGPQGSAKTTALKVLRRIIDPSTVEVLTMPSDAEKLVQQFSHHWAPYYDNLSGLSRQASDAFCRAVTGDGQQKRKLYTDDDVVVCHFKRCPGFCGVNIEAYQPDLLDRCILIGLERIDDDGRKTESDLWKEFEEVRPEFIAGLLDALSKAMKIYPTIKGLDLPRMADFALWGCAVAEAIGWSREEFLKAYGENTALRNEEALENSLVARAIMSVAHKQKTWVGSASSLLADLEDEAAVLRINIKAKRWPKAPNVLTRQINEIRPNLAEIGISIEDGRDSHGRTLRIVSNGVKPTSEFVDSDLLDLDDIDLELPLDDDCDGLEDISSQVSSQRNPCKHWDSAGHDDNDDTFPTLRGGKEDEKEEAATKRGAESIVTTVTTDGLVLSPDKSVGSGSRIYDDVENGTDTDRHEPSSRVLPASTLDWGELEREMYEERAAIIEFDGGLSREDAEEWADTILRQIFAGQPAENQGGDGPCGAD
jgi:hypothetical protein